MALESIGVFYFLQESGGILLSSTYIGHQIYQGNNIKELHRKGWTWDPDWRQLWLGSMSMSMSMSKNFLFCLVGPMREGKPSRKPFITSLRKDLAESSFWYISQRLLGFFGMKRNIYWDVDYKLIVKARAKRIFRSLCYLSSSWRFCPYDSTCCQWLFGIMFYG